jgi:hypothetical protein
MGRIYNDFRGKLYTGESLYEGFVPGDEDSFATCFDSRVYADYMEKGKECHDIRETLGRSLHDRAIGDAMQDFLSRYDEEEGDRQAALEKLEKAAKGRFSPLNYCSRETVQKEIERLKGAV